MEFAGRHRPRQLSGVPSDSDVAARAFLLLELAKQLVVFLVPLLPSLVQISLVKGLAPAILQRILDRQKRTRP